LVLEAADRRLGRHESEASGDPPPTPARLDALLQCDEALEGHGEHELHTSRVVIVARQAVASACAPRGAWTFPRLVQDIEALAGLRHGAEQGVVAARPFLGLAVADDAALDMPLGVDDRAIEVQGEPSQTEAL